MSRGWILAIGAAVLITIAGALALAYYAAHYRVFTASAGSMEPTIPLGSTFLIDLAAYRNVPPQRGDVIVFFPPIDSATPLFKRVVAVPGDRFEIRDGRTVLNGKPLAEPYTREKRTDYAMAIANFGIKVDYNTLDPHFAEIAPRADWSAPDAVPRGCYVVLGDNRNNSEDSHVFGFMCPGRPSHAKDHRPVTIVGRAMLAGH